MLFFGYGLCCTTGASPSCDPTYFVFKLIKNNQIKKSFSIIVLTSKLILNRRKLQN